MIGKYGVALVFIAMIAFFFFVYFAPSKSEMWQFQIVSIDTEKDKMVLNCQLWEEKEKHFTGDPVTIKTKSQTVYLDLGEAELQPGMIVFGQISGCG